MDLVPTPRRSPSRVAHPGDGAGPPAFRGLAAALDGGGTAGAYRSVWSARSQPGSSREAQRHGRIARLVACDARGRSLGVVVWRPDGPDRRRNPVVYVLPNGGGPTAAADAPALLRAAVSGARAAAGDLVLAFPEPEMGGPDRGDAADPAFVDALVDAVEGDRRRDPGRRAVVAVAGAGRSAAALMARRPDVFGRCAVLPAAAGWERAVCALESGWARAV